MIIIHLNIPVFKRYINDIIINFQLSKTLPDYQSKVETKLGVTRNLTTSVEELYSWTEEVRVKLSLGKLSDDDIKYYRSSLEEKQEHFENLDSTFWVLAQNAESHNLTVSESLKVSTTSSFFLIY